eukprot:gene24572-30936_t
MDISPNNNSISNKSSSNDDNTDITTSDYTQLTPFASIDLFTVLHPHTTTDSFINDNNNSNNPPADQRIIYVSVMNHSLLIVSSECSASDSNSSNNCVEKITVVNIDDLSVSRVYQLGENEKIIDIQYPTNNATTSSQHFNNEVYLVTTSSVYCIREDNTTTHIIRQTRSSDSDNKHSSSSEERKLSDLTINNGTDLYIPTINQAQHKAHQKDFRGALSVLEGLIERHKQPSSVAGTSTLVTPNTSDKSNPTSAKSSPNIHTNNANSSTTAKPPPALTKNASKNSISITHSSVLPVSFVSLPRSRASSRAGAGGGGGGGSSSSGVSRVSPKMTAGAQSTQPSSGGLNSCVGGSSAKLNTEVVSAEAAPLSPPPLTYNLFKYITTLRIEYLIEIIVTAEKMESKDTIGQTVDTSSNETSKYTMQLHFLLSEVNTQSQQPSFDVPFVMRKLRERGMHEEASRIVINLDVVAYYMYK